MIVWLTITWLSRWQRNASIELKFWQLGSEFICSIVLKRLSSAILPPGHNSPFCLIYHNISLNIISKYNFGTVKFFAWFHNWFPHASEAVVIKNDIDVILWQFKVIFPGTCYFNISAVHLWRFNPRFLFHSLHRCIWAKWWINNQINEWINK